MVWLGEIDRLRVLSFGVRVRRAAGPTQGRHEVIPSITQCAEWLAGKDAVWMPRESSDCFFYVEGNPLMS
jgi:hypothetical protein